MAVYVEQGTTLASFLGKLVSFTYANLNKTHSLPIGMSTANEWIIYRNCYTTKLIDRGNEKTIADFIRRLKASFPIGLPTDALTINYQVSTQDDTRCRIVISVNEAIDPDILANPQFTSAVANNTSPYFEAHYSKAAQPLAC